MADLLLVFWEIHVAFHGGSTNLQSQQQVTRVPLSPHHYQRLAFLFFMVIAILTGV